MVIAVWRSRRYKCARAINVTAVILNRIPVRGTIWRLSRKLFGGADDDNLLTPMRVFGSDPTACGVQQQRCLAAVTLTSDDAAGARLLYLVTAACSAQPFYCKTLPQDQRQRSGMSTDRWRADEGMVFRRSFSYPAYRLSHCERVQTRLTTTAAIN